MLPCGPIPALRLTSWRGEARPILLIWMPPTLTGENRSPWSGEIPVIVVSAKVGVDDKVNALQTGAADYVSKPFAMRELLARIAVQLRGPRGEEVPCLAFEDLMLDPATRQVTVGGVPVHLTRTEYALCHLLLQNPGRVLSKSAILERISRDYTCRPPYRGFPAVLRATLQKA